MLSLGVIPANIAVRDISLKTRFFGLHFCRKKYWCIYLQPLLHNLPKATEFSEISYAITPFKVTDFGTNRNLIFDFVLVINSN